MPAKKHRSLQPTLAKALELAHEEIDRLYRHNMRWGPPAGANRQDCIERLKVAAASLRTPLSMVFNNDHYVVLPDGGVSLDESVSS